MSGAVVFAADDRDGEQAAVGVISAHHPPEGQSALTVVPITAAADLAAAVQWWQQLGVAGPGSLPVLPRQRAQPGPGQDRARPDAALRAVLSVSAAEVSLTAGEGRLAQQPGGLRRSTADAVRELAWRRAHPDPAAAPGGGDAALVEAGRRLSEDFLDGPVGAALAARVGQAAGLNQVLELGLEVADRALGDLPWEALLVPGASGEIAEAGGSPLVLHRNVALYRLVRGPATGRAHQVRGPYVHHRHGHPHRGFPCGRPPDDLTAWQPGPHPPRVVLAGQRVRSVRPKVRENREHARHVHGEFGIHGCRGRRRRRAGRAECGEEPGAISAQEHDLDPGRHVRDGLGRLLSRGAAGAPGQR
jgi:hypothetical protein